MTATRFLRRPGASVLIRAAAVVAVIVTCAGALLAARAHGVYWSRVQARFLLPQSSANPNSLLTTSSPLVTVAGLVAEMVDPNADAARVASQAVTLADAGVRHGYAVRLPNTGSQFVTIFKTPALDVQAVGTTLQEVSAQMARLSAQIVSALDTLQDQVNVPAVDRIRVQMTPATAPIYYQKGSGVRAAAAVLVLGLSLTFVLTRALLRRVRRRTAAEATADEASSAPVSVPA